MSGLRAIILEVAVVALLCAAATGADFQGIGDLAGGDTVSHALAVSEDGRIVVGRSKVTGDGYQACKWQTGVGLIAAMGGANSGEANAVSANGVVVGRQNAATPAAVIWTDTGMTTLASGGEATDVSEDGAAVVGEYLNGGNTKAFRWYNSVTTDLGDLSGGAVYSRANGISDDGTQVVGLSMSGSGYEAFLYDTSTQTMVGLGDLAGGGYMSCAEAVSAESTVVGSSYSGLGMEAFHWTQSEGIKGLGDLTGGSFHSVARSVSADGSVIVGYGTTANGSEAFIWDPANGMRNLKTVLEDDNGYDLDLTGWTSLTEATSVSANGRVIVGYGVHNGNNEGFIAVLGRPDQDPSTITWSDPDDWDAAMSVVVLSQASGGVVEIQVIKYVLAESDFDTQSPMHCRTGSGVGIQHLHFEPSILNVTKADYFWNWYYNVNATLTRISNASMDKDSLAYGLDNYATNSNYDFWLVHGDGGHQSDYALEADCNAISSPGTGDPDVGDILAYDEGPKAANSVFDHISKVSAVLTTSGCTGTDYADHITWKCGYSGEYRWNPTTTLKVYKTPGRSGTSYIGGSAPVGTPTSDFWTSPVLYRRG